MATRRRARDRLFSRVSLAADRTVERRRTETCVFLSFDGALSYQPYQRDERGESERHSRGHDLICGTLLAPFSYQSLLCLRVAPRDGTLTYKIQKISCRFTDLVD